MQVVEIRLKGHLDQAWADWLDGVAMTYTSEDETLLSGVVTDQAALFGLIAKLRDLGVELESISYNSQEAAAGTEGNVDDEAAGGQDSMPEA